jgi:hypothetical protein
LLLGLLCFRFPRFDRSLASGVAHIATSFPSVIGLPCGRFISASLYGDVPRLSSLAAGVGQLDAASRMFSPITPLE